VKWAGQSAPRPTDVNCIQTSLGDDPQEKTVCVAVRCLRWRAQVGWQLWSIASKLSPPQHSYSRDHSEEVLVRYGGSVCLPREPPAHACTRICGCGAALPLSAECVRVRHRPESSERSRQRGVREEPPAPLAHPAVFLPKRSVLVPWVSAAEITARVLKGEAVLNVRGSCIGACVSRWFGRRVAARTYMWTD